MSGLETISSTASQVSLEPDIRFSEEKRSRVSRWRQMDLEEHEERKEMESLLSTKEAMPEVMEGAQQNEERRKDAELTPEELEQRKKRREERDKRREEGQHEVAQLKPEEAEERKANRRKDHERNKAAELLRELEELDKLIEAGRCEKAELNRENLNRREQQHEKYKERPRVRFGSKEKDRCVLSVYSTSSTESRRSTIHSLAETCDTISTDISDSYGHRIFAPEDEKNSHSLPPHLPGFYEPSILAAEDEGDSYAVPRLRSDSPRKSAEIFQIPQGSRGSRTESHSEPDMSCPPRAANINRLRSRSESSYQPMGPVVVATTTAEQAGPGFPRSLALRPRKNAGPEHYESLAFNEHSVFDVASGPQHRCEPNHKPLGSHRKLYQLENGLGIGMARSPDETDSRASPSMKEHRSSTRRSSLDSSSTPLSLASSAGSPPLSKSNVNRLSLSSRSTDASSDSTTCSGSSSTETTSSSDDSDVLSLAGKKKMLLERLMHYFFSVVSPNLSSHPGVQRPSGCGGSTRQTYNKANTGKKYSNRTDGTKKKDGKRLLEGEDNQQSGGGDEQKKPRLETTDDPKTTRLACPYFKKNQQRYCTWRSCPGPGWATVHRVKEHLYRCHALPITCPRCHESFDTTTLRDSHIVADERCEVRDRPEFDGFDSNQEKQLRSRKKGSKHLSEADKWRDVYLILFPDTGADEIPSPYLDFGGNADPGEAESAFSRYEQFLRRELPKMVRRELEARIDQALEPLEENLKSQIVDIVRDAQMSLFQSFVSANPESSENEKTSGFIESDVSGIGGETAPHGGQWALDGQLEAFRPEPYLQGNVDDFEGLLFGLSTGSTFSFGQQAGNHMMGNEMFAGPSGFGQQDSTAAGLSLGFGDWDSACASMSSGSQFDFNNAINPPEGYSKELEGIPTLEEKSLKGSGDTSSIDRLW